MSVTTSNTTARIRLNGLVRGEFTQHPTTVAPPAIERVFRRCSEREASAMLSIGGLVNGSVPINDHNGHKSHPKKWISDCPRFIYRYSPTSAQEGMYNRIVIIELKPGTINQLREMKLTGIVEKGRPSTYGIPGEKINWFNNQITSVSMSDKNPNPKNPLLPIQPNFDVLVDKIGNPCFFLAFPSDLLVSYPNSKNVDFGDNIDLYRTTWLKTSLMWTIWRSNFATRSNMNRLLQLALPLSYLEHLSSSARQTKEVLHQDEILYQRDPDKAPHYGRSSDQFLFWLPFGFSDSGSTMHFALRNKNRENPLLDLVTNLSRGRMFDITHEVQWFFQHCKVEESRISETLYSNLGLARGTYYVTRD